MSEQLQKSIFTFLSLLRESWGSVLELGKTIPNRAPEEFVADWMQASWEMIVEAALSQNGIIFLEPYGDGADCNEVGSRVWRPGMASTHAVHCVSTEGKESFDVLTGKKICFPEDGYALDKFVTASNDGWYLAEPPFNHVLFFKDGKDTVVKLDDVEFVLKKLANE